MGNPDSNTDEEIRLMLQVVLWARAVVLSDTKEDFISNRLGLIEALDVFDNKIDELYAPSKEAENAARNIFRGEKMPPGIR